MARPTFAAIETAVANAFAALSSGNTKTRMGGRARAAVQTLNEVSSYLLEAYRPNITVTASGADVAALIAAIGAAKGRAAEVGDVFSVTSSADTDDDVLETAKGGAPEAGDVFEVTNVTSASEEVVYLGNDAPDFSDEYTSNFTGQPGNLDET